MRVWHEGKLLKGRVAISAFDRGLTLGDGIFETIAVTNGVPLLRFEHLQRMAAAAATLGIPFPEDDIDNAIDALTHRAGGHNVLRLTLTRGEATRGLGSSGKSPTLIGTLQSFDSDLRFKPATLITSSIRRNEHSPAAGLKTTSYIDNILAAREAETTKADDAVMLNSKGNIACTTIANVFLVVENVLITPPLTDGVLPGIMRSAVVSSAKRLNIAVQEMSITPTDAKSADAMFLTNSLRFIRPATRYDDRRFRSTPKPIRQLMEALLQSEQDQLKLV
jgi:branched-chain amino acid aminotransferase